MSLIEDIRNIFTEHIFNEIPIYLLHLPGMVLMRRDDIRNAVVPLIEEMAEKHKGKQIQDVEKAVRDSMRKELGYAILSHRWLDEGEPTFQDLQNLTSQIRDGAGFKKLEGFCSKAYESGCQWGWSDTCCIDKSSSANLEESIRSMFTWYHNAKVCIAYLGDATGPSDWYKSGWFSRGWTLQELLAPRELKIFVGGWMPLTYNLNDKEDIGILQALCSATGIPVDDLKSFEPSAERIREKLNWASGRKTTREEDIAYCLIGILDVSLSISYGEGKRAFYRLQVEIIRNTHDWGLLLWSGERSKYNSALAASPKCFNQYPADVDAIDDIQLMVAANITSKDVWSEWQQFRTSNYLHGSQVTEFQYGDHRSLVLRRPGRLHLTTESDFRQIATRTGVPVRTVNGHQVNTISFSLEQSSGGTVEQDLNNIFKQPRIPWAEGNQMEDDDDGLYSDEERMGFDEEWMGFDEERMGFGEDWIEFDEEQKEYDRRIRLGDRDSTPIQCPTMNNDHVQHNILKFAVNRETFFSRRAPTHSTFNIIGGDQHNRFILSSEPRENYLPIAVVCGDITTDLAVASGMGSAFVSDLDLERNVDNGDHLVNHFRAHIKAAIDPAIDKASRLIDAAIGRLGDGPKLGQCHRNIQARVRNDINEYFDHINIFSWVLDEISRRRMSIISAQTSFELTQRGLKLSLPLLEVTSSTGFPSMEEKGQVRIYKLKVNMLEEVLIETKEELLVSASLKLAILDCKESEEFNILSRLVTRMHHRHQALLLRVSRLDKQQYRKVSTEDIIQVKRFPGSDQAFGKSISTVYLK